MALWLTTEDIHRLMKNNKIHIKLGLKPKPFSCSHSKHQGLWQSVA